MVLCPAAANLSEEQLALLFLFQDEGLDLLSIQQFIFGQQVQQIFLVIKIIHNSCLQGDLSA